MGVFERFNADRRGTVAILFGLSLIPIVAMTGAAVDYGRASLEQTRLQRAVDAAALALTSEPATTSASDLQLRAEQLFLTLYGAPDFVTAPRPVATRSGQNIDITVNTNARNAFMQVVGIPQTSIGAASHAVFGQDRIELALVLDNTGSMADNIGGQRKIDALKAAALRLIADLRAIARDPDTVKVSIVPFDTEVRLDAAAYRGKDWFNFSAPSDRAAWTGYVYDRPGAYTISDAAPATGTADSFFPAPRDSQWRTNPLLVPYGVRSDLATMRPLTSLYDSANVTALTTLVNGMAPRANTNISLGLMWGLATLTPSEPFTEGAPMGTARVHKYLLLLTDGLNTMGETTSVPNFNVASLDANTSAACTLTKSKTVEVFTIRLLDGDQNLLRSCASGSDHYFDVQNTTQLTNAFQTIIDAISGTA